MKKTHLSEDELQDLRANLEAERDSLDEELAEHGQSNNGDWQGGSGELRGEEADPTDAADKIEELVTNVPLVEELETRRKEIEAALKKMDDGTYGICEKCGEPIPVDRLEANPAAKTCITHV
ncbi:MAG: TraR/DksA C4-type zinc finger protein [Candidatus Kaiserbacteria bacterium]|nr:MAG: TraR/DksA C4-type zinc finger protein [Candidatus Kaiserbacteria bacterium]